MHFFILKFKKEDTEFENKIDGPRKQENEKMDKMSLMLTCFDEDVISVHEEKMSSPGPQLLPKREDERFVDHIFTGVR